MSASLPLQTGQTWCSSWLLVGCCRCHMVLNTRAPPAFASSPPNPCLRACSVGHLIPGASKAVCAITEDTMLPGEAGGGGESRTSLYRELLCWQPSAPATVACNAHACLAARCTLTCTCTYAIALQARTELAPGPARLAASRQPGTLPPHTYRRHARSA